MNVTTLTEYTPEIAARVRELLIQLSRSGKDRGEIPEAWFKDLIASPSHDMLLAYDEDSQIVGIATLSIIMGPIVRRAAYLEDFVTDQTVRGKGVGTALWNAILDWSKAKDCTELCFTSGHGREAAQAVYLHKGATIYDTNYCRLTLK